jgi:hypothetical protein
MDQRSEKTREGVSHLDMLHRKIYALLHLVPFRARRHRRLADPAARLRRGQRRRKQYVQHRDPACQGALAADLELERSAPRPANRALTAYLLDGNSQVLTQNSGQSDPTLLLDYTNTSAVAQVLRLAVSLDSGSAQGLIVQVTEGSSTCNIECQPLAHSTAGLAGGTIGDIADALVVGATYAKSPNNLEAWSNRGPFRVDFQATADAASPDGFDYARLSTPLQVAKPDLVSPDCVTTPFSDGTRLTNNQFCGTSAAVPSIAGAAALLESAGFNRVQVLKALRTTAVPLGAAKWDPGYGFGLADAAAALRSGGN